MNLAVVSPFVDSIKRWYRKFGDPKRADYNPDKLYEILAAEIDFLVELSEDDKKVYTYLRCYIVKNSRNFQQIFDPFLLHTEFPKDLLYCIAEDTLDVR